MIKKLVMTKKLISKQLKNLISLIITGLILSGLCIAQNLEKPNVIVILTDDQGSIDLNSFGANDLLTPNMDKIVNSGVKFTQFCATPVCSPTRASLLTGKTPQHLKITEVVKRSKPNDGLSNEEYTMAEMFKDAGYAKGHLGKWHLGYSEDNQPNAQGFDYSFGHLGGCVDNFSHSSYWQDGANYHDLYLNGGEIYRDGEFFPNMMLEEAKDFIMQNKNHPFFIYYALNVPHYPYQGSKEWLDYYNEKGVDYPRNLYAAFLSTMDDNIGNLIAKLESLGLKENTIIVFQSDNGYANTQRAHGGGGSSGPYRGHKGSLFEGGIRVPAAISWTKNIQPNQTRHQMAVIADWMPTLAYLCGIELNKDDLDGKSLVPILKNENIKSLHDEYTWQYQKQKAVRKGDWKLLINPVIKDLFYKNTIKQKPPYFLVNLKDDIGETTNLAEKHPKKVKELETIFNKQNIRNHKRK
jgi:arylsulfatase A-like enzyme